MLEERTCLMPDYEILPSKICLMDHLPHSLVTTQPFSQWYVPQKIEEDSLHQATGVVYGLQKLASQCGHSHGGGVVGRVQMVVSPKVGLMSEQGKPMSK